MRGLADKQQRWIEAYVGVARFNATEAARLAGYSDPKNSGNANKRNAIIRAHVKEWLADHTLSADEVLRELTDVGSADWQHFVTVKRDRDGDIVDARMDLNAKIKSLELLGKAYGLFTDKLDVKGTMTLADLILAAQSAGDEDTPESTG